MLVAAIFCSTVCPTMVFSAYPINYPTPVGSICVFKSFLKVNYCEAMKRCKKRGGELLRGEKNLQEVIQVECV